MESSKITIEVAYAKPERQLILTVDVAHDSTIEDAIHASGILQEFPEIDLEKQGVGIFSQPKSLRDKIKAGDRIEIYRSLIADPKEKRRDRAKQQL